MAYCSSIGCCPSLGGSETRRSRIHYSALKISFDSSTRLYKHGASWLGELLCRGVVSWRNTFRMVASIMLHASPFLHCVVTETSNVSTTTRFRYFCLKNITSLFSWDTSGSTSHCFHGITSSVRANVHLRHITAVSLRTQRDHYFPRSPLRHRAGGRRPIRCTYVGRLDAQ